MGSGGGASIASTRSNYPQPRMPPRPARPYPGGESRVRDYSVLVDASSSMRLADGGPKPSLTTRPDHTMGGGAAGGTSACAAGDNGGGRIGGLQSRWELARDALELLVPMVVERDEDGISLYFFSTGFRKFTRVNSVEVFENIKFTCAPALPPHQTFYLSYI